MYINDVGFDTPNSNNHLVLSMLKQFLEDGNSVYYVGSHSTGIYSDIPQELSSSSNFTFDIVDKKVINRSSFVKRYLTAIRYEFAAKKQWKKRIREIDIVIVQSHYSAFFTFLLLKRYNKKLVFNIYDIFPGTSFEASGIPSRLVYHVFSFLQQFIYKTTKRVFTLTEDTKQSLISLGVAKEKIEIIPNWFDSKAIRRQEYNSFLKEFSLDPQKKYIQYAGQIGVSYDFKFIINVADYLRDRDDIVFEFVGEGLYLSELKEETQNRGLANVRFIPWQPLERLSEVYSSCTLQMIPLKGDIIFNSYPSKILPLMGCKRTAVISVDDNSFFYREMNENRLACCVPLNDVKAFSRAIVELCDNDQLRSEYEDNAYKYVIKKYTAHANIKKMLKVFTDMMEE